MTDTNNFLDSRVFQIKLLPLSADLWKDSTKRLKSGEMSHFSDFLSRVGVANNEINQHEDD